MCEWVPELTVGHDARSPLSGGPRARQRRYGGHIRTGARWLGTLVLGAGAQTASAETFRVPSQVATIQAAIDGSATGDTVLVAPGVYTGEGFHDIRFTPDGAEPPRDLVVVSESGPELTVLDIQGTDEDNRRGFVFEEGETSASVVEGFTIRNGYMSLAPTRSDPAHEVSGGGIVIRGIGTSPIIRNCIFESNHSQISGGALEAEILASPTIESCVFLGNSSLQGGAISLESNSAAVIRDCLLAGNTAGLCGGGIYFTAGGTIENTTIAGNHADQGGGVDASFPASPTLRNVIVWGNCANTRGDEVFAQQFATLTFECSLVGQDVDPDGTINYDQDCIFEDPLFCGLEDCENAPSLDGYYALQSNSPALQSASSCGRIGAYGQGCGTMPVEAVSWSRLKSRFAR